MSIRLYASEQQVKGVSKSKQEAVIGSSRK